MLRKYSRRQAHLAVCLCCVCLVAQLCLTLCEPKDHSPRLLCSWDSPGKNTGVGCHCLLQGIFPTQDWTCVSYISCIAGRFFTNCRGGKIISLYSSGFLAAAAAAKSLQSCPTLCDPRDGSPPGSPVPGILQARTLEWVAISFSNAWKWKVKVKSLSRVRPSWPHGLQPTRLLCPWVAEIPLK